MKHKHIRFLAAKTALVLGLTVAGFSTPAHAGIPVIDGTNLAQNIMTAIESVAQTLKQIEQYRTQLQQYENMLQNTAAPAAYIWDQAQTTINGLMNAVDTLSYYERQLGSIDGYLDKFQDVNYYKSSPCFTNAGCSAAEWNAMKQVQQLASQSQKKANDALFRGLKDQQQNLKNDASTLQRLQSAAQGATGRCKPSATPTSSPVSRLISSLQIRGLLIAQQNAVTTQACRPKPTGRRSSKRRGNRFSTWALPPTAARQRGTDHDEHASHCRLGRAGVRCFGRMREVRG
jgi:P-type conjugative transfer protein TrbJ